MDININIFLNVEAIVHSCLNPINKELVRTFLLKQKVRIVSGHRDQVLAGRWDYFIAADKACNEIHDIENFNKYDLRQVFIKDNILDHIKKFYLYWPHHTLVNREYSYFYQYCLNNNIY